MHFRLLGRDAEYRGNQRQLKKHPSRQKQIHKQKQKQVNFVFSQMWYIKIWRFVRVRVPFIINKLLLLL